MNDLLGQLRKSVTPDEYQNAMSLIQDQFEQDMPYICLYWRAGALLSRNAFTDARDIRELELLRGVESFGMILAADKPGEDGCEVVVDEDFLENAPADAWCFVEDRALLPWLPAIRPAAEAGWVAASPPPPGWALMCR